MRPLEEEFDEEEIPEHVYALFVFNFCAVGLWYGAVLMIFQFLKDHLTFFFFYQAR